MSVCSPLVGGGDPIPGSGRGVPHPADGGDGCIPSRGHPIPGQGGGYPIQLTGGEPHPDDGWYPITDPGRGYPSQVQPKGGGFPIQVMGIPHPRSGWQIPHSRSGSGINTPPPPRPRSRTGSGTPPPPQAQDWMGYPPLPIRRQSSIASTCYAAGGMPLAFMQEDFHVPD